MIFDRAQMNVSSTGTGTLQLNTNTAGSQSFANSGIANAGTSSYGINDATNAYEYGTGQYISNSSGLFWIRTTVVASSNNSTVGGAGSPINATAAANVYLTFLDLDYNSHAANSTGSYSIGNSTANAYGNSTIEVLANSTSQTVITPLNLSLGNSIANAFSNSIIRILANSTSQTVVTPASLYIANSTANVTANLSGFYIGPTIVTLSSYGFAVPNNPNSANFGFLGPGNAQSNCVVTNTNSGFILSVVNSTSANMNAIIFGNVVPAGSTWTQRIGFNLNAPINQEYYFGGISLWSNTSSNTRNVFWIAAFEHDTSPFPLLVGHLASGGVFNNASGPTPLNALKDGTMMWLHVYFDSANYNYFYSPDGNIKQRFFTESATAWMPANATHIGIGITGSALGNGCQMNVFDWTSYAGAP